MCVAARLGRALGITPSEVLDRQHHLLKDLLGSPIEVPVDLPPQAVYAAMLADNKRRGGSMVRFLLLEGLGRPYNPDGHYLMPVPGDLVMQALTRT
jgi:3-dehydroquinate synthetase